VSGRLLCTSLAAAIEAASMCLDTYPRLSAVLPSEREADLGSLFEGALYKIKINFIDKQSRF
jgi:hypothetical protein